MADARVAVVTGAAQGLGRAVADRMVQGGFRVCYVDVNGEKLDDIDGGANAMTAVADVSDPQAVAQVVQAVLSRWGKIEVLVNNAGIRYETPLEAISLEEWNRVLAVNLTGTFLFSQAVLPQMRRQRWGRIIIMSSYGGQAGPLTSGAHYCASKAGQLALMKVLARMVAQEGVTVNAVAPAAIHTPEMDRIDPEKLSRMVASIPVGRVGEPEEVAELVWFLASEAAGYITGATFDINGGLLMR